MAKKTGNKTPQITFFIICSCDFKSKGKEALRTGCGKRTKLKIKKEKQS